MAKVISTIRDKHALWYKGLVFAFCVILSTYLLPKQHSFNIKSITTGEVWLDEDLITPFDFLVKKNKNELAIEKKESKKQIGYFKKTPIIVGDILSNFPELNHSSNSQLQITLDSIYKRGVYQSFTNSSYQDSIMYVVENNEVTLTLKQQLYSQEKIKSLLSSIIKNENQLNKLLAQIKPNIYYDEILSNEMVVEEEPQNIYKSKVKKGETIFHKNEIVTPEQNNVFESYRIEMLEQEKQTPVFSIIVGQLLSCVLVLGIMMLFLAFFRKPIFSQNSQVTFIFLIIMLMILITSTVAKYNVNYVYAVPFCLVPILIRVFFDSRTSLFTFLNIILICAFFTTDKFEFVFIQLIGGIGTIFSVADMGKRSKLFLSALLAFIFYILSYAAYHLVNDTEQALLHVQNYFPFLISSVCVLFSFPLIYILEKIFSLTSDFTLMELCDLNNPLLRELSQKIPGTFQHSLQVANLAEEACYKIGANALLVRTGAMYHDVGKLSNPRFFTENQVGEVSPHEELTPEESAKIIIGHVVRGVEIAKEYLLPEAVIDFIRTHHGTTTTSYFLHYYKKEHEGEVIDENLFRYPGPIPFSKETAILMMADSVEASSRSLKKYDATSIDELVEKIINYQISENQFLNSDITFKDINQIKKIFKKRLMNIYHVRIEYPR